MYKCPVATATPPDEEKKSRDAMKNNFLKAIFFYFTVQKRNGIAIGLLYSLTLSCIIIVLAALTQIREVKVSRDYWTVDNANLSRFTRSSYLLD